MICTSTTTNTTTTMMMITKKIFWILLTTMVILRWHSVDALSMISSNNHSKPIPITVLSGFLGSGKTTLLQNMLQNKEGLKIAIIVNDVASVNIDSKLVAGAGADAGGGGTSTDGQLSASSDGLVELQNGCACCSLSDELLTSVSRLVTMSDLRDDDDQFDHIVVELSGVADPKSVRAKFQEAVMEQMPLLDRVQLDTMVTLVDASTFESHFKSTAQANREETPELYYRDGETPTSNENEDDVELLEPWMKDLPPKLLEVVMAEINGHRSEEDDVGGVAELLVSQTETADLVIINKDDLVPSSEELSRLKDIIKALNPRAQIVTTSYGKLSIQSVLAIGCAKGVVVAGAVDDHRDYVNAASNAIDIDNIDDESSSHSHSSHDHDHHDDVNDNNNIIVESATDTTTPSSHSHSAHSHDHHDEQQQQQQQDSKDSTDITSSHSRSHSHSHDHHDGDSSCTDPDCTDTSHSHTHSHDHSSSSCDDPDCTDPSHSHSHSHSHDGEATTTHAGIGSFVFRARRPFHPGRLVAFLRYLPVVRGIPEAAADNNDDHEKNENEKEKVVVSEQARIALLAVLRSKGFIWCANSHNDAMYWSHAGSSFDLSCLGSWWATLPRNQWPPGVEEYVLQDFDVPEHDDETNPVGVGDRRQEVVFIGQGLQDTICQTEISNALRQCLLDDDEYDEYQSICKEIGIDYESKLRTRFANLIDSKIVAY